MNGYGDQTCHVMFLGEFAKNKKYKEQIIQRIKDDIFAMLNSNGGKVVIDVETEENAIPVGGTPFTNISNIPLVIRILEQSMTSVIGIHQTITNINFLEDTERIVIFVKKSGSLITTNYNLYLPSQTQVVLISPWEPLETVKDDIINRKVVVELVQIGSHCQIFCKGTICDIRESKTVQLKHLEAHATKRTTLADRMIGKGNKFPCYVSAFANFRGGHVYYGVADSRVVVGEVIQSEEDKGEITKKVEKVIKKTIWPERIGQPKRGEHWDIFFEPVVDEDNKPIPSTFVIVIYIASCLGGVFTEEPECYEMVDGKVCKMSLATWKKRILTQPIEPLHVDNISLSGRVTWNSTSVRNHCVIADHLLTQSVNNGQSIATISASLEHIFPDHKIELKLLVLSKKVMINYRTGCFNKAAKLLDTYNHLLTKTTEFEIFDAICVYLQTALYRAKGDVRAMNAILPCLLEMVKNIAPGHITALLCLLAATVIGLSQFQNGRFRDMQAYSPAAFSDRALEHLQCTKDAVMVQADMYQKSHMTSALFYLGGDMTGKLTREHIDGESLRKANSSIMAVEKSIEDGNELTIYRKIGFDILKSIRCYRYSQAQQDSKSLLEEAFNLAKRAECLAVEYKFAEMVNWARAYMGLWTECLVRRHVS